MSYLEYNYTVRESLPGWNMSGEARRKRSKAMNLKRKTSEGERLNGDAAVRNGKNRLSEAGLSSTDDLVLWRSPIRVLKYSACELGLDILEWIQTLKRHKTILLVFSLVIGFLTIARYTPGQHQVQIALIENYLLWCGWWVGLGILSSVGLGSGLHTFLLYLGPHIAAVTLAAYECQSTDFPQPPYPDSIICPDSSVAGGAVITIWDILAKVRVEAFCWGAGTAIGELPPYFMARAARLSGSEPGEEEEDFLALQEKLKHPETMTWWEWMKHRIQLLVERAGFVGILLCASIPNPAFDLAGVTCGHFLVPFRTFFGATLIGKAIIKMHIQKIFVIFAFNETLLESAIAQLHRIPMVGATLEAPIRTLLEKQKQKLHNRSGEADLVSDQGNIVSSIFEKFVLAMVVFFVVSIIHSLARSYHKRKLKKEASRSL